MSEREAGRSNDIDELLARVRSLQRLLPTPERPHYSDTPPHRFCSKAVRHRRAPGENNGSPPRTRTKSCSSEASSSSGSHGSLFFPCSFSIFFKFWLFQLARMYQRPPICYSRSPSFASSSNRFTGRNHQLHSLRSSANPLAHVKRGQLQGNGFVEDS